ncbi:MAG: sigma-70 family RNA polymerase sigma factor [Steroidobacteraceae bacterium]
MNASLGQPTAPFADASDLKLVRSAQSGQSRAFDQLVLKYRPTVVQLAMRYTRNSADAEDTAQEVFIKAYRALRHFRCDSAFYTWLYRIAINTARNVLKVRRRHLAEFALDSPDDDDAALHSTRLRELATPEELTLVDDIHATVNAALQALSEALRTVIILREIEGLTYKQISRAIGIPVGTVRSRVFRARNFIDHQLRRVSNGGLGRGASAMSGSSRGRSLLSTTTGLTE